MFLAEQVNWINIFDVDVTLFPNMVNKSEIRSDRLCRLGYG